MIIFFTKDHYGKDTSELPSSLLVWIIEHKDDWALVQECKKELSERLKLDWQPVDTNLKKENEYLKSKITFIEKIMFVFGISHWDTDKYCHSPQWLEEDFNSALNDNTYILPIKMERADFRKEYMKKFRESDEYKKCLSPVIPLTKENLQNYIDRCKVKKI